MKIFSRIAFIVVLCFKTFSNEYILVDEESETFIQEIVDKISSVLNCQQKIEVYISSNRTLNAGASQSGNIVVNVGAILNCSDVTEFIAIVAHEVGHIAGNHITTFMSNQSDFTRAGLVTMLIGATASIFAKDPTPLAAGLFSGQSVGYKMALAKLRQKESMADSRSAEAIQKLGWPIFKGCVSLHEKLASGDPMYNAYESTHPSSQDRVSKFRNLYNEEKSHEADPEKIKYIKCLQTKFEIIQTKIKALTFDPEYIEEIYRVPKNNSEKYAKAIALYRNNEYESAVALIDTIDDENIGKPHLAEIKSMCLINLKKPKEAAEIAKQYLGGKQLYRDLSMIYADAIVEGNFEKGEIQNGIKILKKLKIKYPSDPSIVDMLGKLFYLNNETDKASLCAAEVNMQIGDVFKAQTHAQKALKSQNKFVKRSAEDILDSLKNIIQE